MDFHIYFEFDDSERKRIALSVNGISVGLQTQLFQGNRAYSYSLRNHQGQLVDLNLKALDNDINIRLYIVNNKGEILVTYETFLSQKGGGLNIQADLQHFRISRAFRASASFLNTVAKTPGRRQFEKVKAKGKNSVEEYEKLLAAYKNQVKRSKLLTAKADEPQNTLVDVYYATDRARKKSKKNRITYTNSRGDLEIGKCVVNVPGNRDKGSLPLPPWYLFGMVTNDDLYMSIKEVTPLDAENFFNEIQAKVSDSPEKDVLLFIHGFNVSFTESVMRTAQISADIGFRGAPVVYSWPSRKSIIGYAADEATATGYSIDNIIRLIKDIRTTTGAERVHLIAHSMGNRFLTDAIKSLNDQGFTKDFQFNQIILAAPDVDAEVFVKHIAPKIAGAAEQVTLYTSVNDKALSASKLIHGGVQRAGTAGKELAVAEGIDTIDASKEKTDVLGHGYFAESRALINDIFAATRHGHSPGERNLRMRSAGAKIYWDFN